MIIHLAKEITQEFSIGKMPDAGKIWSCDQTCERKIYLPCKKKMLLGISEMYECKFLFRFYSERKFKTICNSRTCPNGKRVCRIFQPQIDLVIVFEISIVSYTIVNTIASVNAIIPKT